MHEVTFTISFDFHLRSFFMGVQVGLFFLMCAYLWRKP